MTSRVNDIGAFVRTGSVSVSVNTDAPSQQFVSDANQSEFTKRTSLKET